MKDLSRPPPAGQRSSGLLGQVVGVLLILFGLTTLLVWMRVGGHGEEAFAFLFYVFGLPALLIGGIAFYMGNAAARRRDE